MSTCKDLDFSKYDEEEEEANLFRMVDDDECSLDDFDDKVDFIDLHSIIETYHVLFSNSSKFS